PANFLKLSRAARAGSFQGVPDTVGMIRNLNSRLAARAELALTDGVVRVALQFFCQAHLNQAYLAVADHFRIAFHHSDHQAAARWTHRANARLPFGHAGRELFLGDEANELVLRVAAIVERCGGPSDGRDFNEI